MPARFFVEMPLAAGQTGALPEGAARHVQVLRLQPGASITLFDGQGGEWEAEVLEIGRREVQVCVGAHHPLERELPVAVTLALGMPANERMDGLVEKATELGVAAIQPLVCERSVLRLAGERAQRKQAHWQAVAVAAAEQCGRTRLPRIEPVRTFGEWLRSLPSGGGVRWVLSLRDTSARLAGPAHGDAVTLLSGPEGGLTPDEEQAACRQSGFRPLNLGPRVLRADTAPLAALVLLGATLA